MVEKLFGVGKKTKTQHCVCVRVCGIAFHDGKLTSMKYDVSWLYLCLPQQLKKNLSPSESVPLKINRL